MSNNNIRDYLAQVKPKSLQSNSSVNSEINDIGKMNQTSNRTHEIRQTMNKEFNMQDFIEKQSQSKSIPSGSFGEKFGPSSLEKELFTPKLNDIVTKSQNNTDALGERTQFRKKKYDHYRKSTLYSHN
jgi:hypothetical protein